MKSEKTVFSDLANATEEARNSFMTIAELNSYVANFGDMSDDTMLGEMLDMSIREIELITGKIVISRTINDYYNCWNNYFELSQDKIPADTAFSIKYFDSEYQENTLDKTINNYFLDATDETGRLIFPRVPNYNLSELHSNPISVTYTSSIDHEMLDSAKHAAQYMVKQMYKDERPSVNGVNMRPVYRMLKPFRQLVL